jgi:hypothetical protein
MVSKPCLKYHFILLSLGCLNLFKAHLYHADANWTTVDIFEKHE